MKPRLLPSSCEYHSALVKTTEELKLNPQDSDAWRFRAALYEQLNDLPAALADANTAIELDNNNMRAYDIRADIERQLGKYDDAIRDAKQAVLLDSTYGPAYWVLIKSYMSMNRYQDALNVIGSAPIQSFTKLIQSEIYMLSAEIKKTHLKNNKSALADIDLAIKANNNNPDAYLMMARIHLAEKDDSLALDAANKVLRLEDDQSKSDLALLYILRANFNLGSSLDFDIDKLSRLILSGQHLFECYLLRGEIYLHKHHYRKAWRDFDESIKLKGQQPGVLFLRAYAKANLGDYSGALTDVNRGIELSAAAYDGYVIRAYIYCGQGKLNEALIDINHAFNKIEKNQKTGIAYIYAVRAMIRERLGSFSDALDDVKAAMDNLERNRASWSFIQTTLASIKCKMNEYVEAEKILRQVCEEDQRYIPAHELLANVYDILHQPGLAFIMRRTIFRIRKAEQPPSLRDTIKFFIHDNHYAVTESVAQFKGDVDHLRETLIDNDVTSHTLALTRPSTNTPDLFYYLQLQKFALEKEEADRIKFSKDSDDSNKRRKLL